MSDRKCEAAAMDAAFFDNWDKAVPPCGEPAEILRHGYALCGGCDEALALLADLGGRLQ